MLFILKYIFFSLVIIGLGHYLYLYLLKTYTTPIYKTLSLHNDKYAELINIVNKSPNTQVYPHTASEAVGTSMATQVSTNTNTNTNTNNNNMVLSTTYGGLTATNSSTIDENLMKKELNTFLKQYQIN